MLYSLLGMDGRSSMNCSHTRTHPGIHHWHARTVQCNCLDNLLVHRILKVNLVLDRSGSALAPSFDAYDDPPPRVVRLRMLWIIDVDADDDDDGSSSASSSGHRSAARLDVDLVVDAYSMAIGWGGVSTTTSCGRPTSGNSSARMPC